MTTKLEAREEPAIYRALFKPAAPIVRLGQLLTVIRGVTYKKEAAKSAPAAGLVGLLRATNIQQSLSFDDLVYVPARCVSETQLLRPGDIVVVASSGSRTVVGKAAPLTHPWEGSFGAFCFALRPNAGVEPSYLAAFLRSPQYRDRVSDLAAGTNINNLRATHIEETPIPVPEIGWQREIVAYLDEQLSRLDAGVAALHRVQANLKRYRASVLKAACEGRLVPTEAELARREGRLFDSGAQLLRRILAERRERLTALGKHKEAVVPATIDLGVLPEGWTWSSIEQLNLAARPCAYGVLQPGGERDDGVPFVRVGDVNDGRIENEGMKRIDPEIAAAYPRTKLRGGEVLITLVGAIGRTAVVPQALAGANTARAVGVIPLSERVSPHWVEVWLRNPSTVARMTAASHEVARKTLNLEDVRAAAVGLPPLAEQHRIVAEADRRLSLIRVAEAQVAANLARSRRLRQSILQAAFAEPIASGELAPAAL